MVKINIDTFQQKNFEEYRRSTNTARRTSSRRSHHQKVCQVRVKVRAKLSKWIQNGAEQI